MFKFGRAEAGKNQSDRLSVYGIGLKRAIFKCGNKIETTSDHSDGGFDLDLDVKQWELDKSMPWTFDIIPRPPERDRTGTKITIRELHNDVTRRISDGVFVSQLKEIISRTYAFFIDRIVVITVNGDSISGEPFEVGSNYSNRKFSSGAVTCNITAGIAAATVEIFRERNAGWYVFCNGRTVLFADKSPLTGWGSGLPMFQPKHRPFLGIVSSSPRNLRNSRGQPRKRRSTKKTQFGRKRNARWSPLGVLS